MRWIAEKGFEREFREVILPNLAALESAGATLLKRTVTRSVYKLDLPEVGAVFIKHHKPASLAEKIKYLVLRSRAAAEWDVSRAMAERGIPVARSLAVGERRVAGVLVEAVLVSGEITGAASLVEDIRLLGGSAARGEAFRCKRALLRNVAELVRKAHDAGIAHRDLHGGNVLVAGGQLFLIDLHRVRIGRTCSRRQRIASLARLLAPPDLLTWGDRMRFIRAYLSGSSEEGDVRSLAHAVGRVITQLRERRYASRTKRCVKKSTGFRQARLGAFKVCRCAEFPAETVLQAIERHSDCGLQNEPQMNADSADSKREKHLRPPAVICGQNEKSAIRNPQSSILKSDRRGRVTAVEMSDERCPVRTLCVKEFIRRGLMRRIGDFFRGSPAKRAWLGAQGCAAREIGTPKALAIAELRRCPFASGARSFFITEYIAGSSRLNDYVADRCRPADPESVRRWRAFIKAAAAFVRRLHSHRLRHRDLSAKNILVREREGGWDFYLVDVGDIRLRRAPSLAFKTRNLGQLDQIYVKPSRADRLRFFKHYSRGKPEFNRPELLAQIDAISRARHAHWLESGGAEILEERKRLGKPV